MLNNIDTSSEDFLKIVDIYYEKDNFSRTSEIFKKLIQLHDEIKESSPEDEYKKIFESLPSTDQEIDIKIDLNEIKLKYPDYFLHLVKYLQNFADEVISFLKIIIHYNHIYEGGLSGELGTFHHKFQKIINLFFSHSIDIFNVNSASNLKINSYVELNSYIKKVSSLKTINRKLKISCSICGLLFVKNVREIHTNKMFNSFNLTNDKKFHICQDIENFDIVKSSSQKIFREYIDPILMRYFAIEIIPDKLEENFKKIDTQNNNTILCICKEKLMPKLCTNVKISGIVKTRPNKTSLNNENFFEKIIEIVNIEKNEDYNSEILMKLNTMNIDDEFNHNQKECYSHNYNRCRILKNNKIIFEDIKRIEKLSSFKCLPTFILMNIVNPKLCSGGSLDFSNIISLYFIFSKNIELKIHIFDKANNDILKIFFKDISESVSLSDSFLFHDFTEQNEDLISGIKVSKPFEKLEKSDEFLFKYGNGFNATGKFLIISNIPNNINSNLTTFLSINTLGSKFKVVSGSGSGSTASNSSNNYFSITNFLTINSLLTSSKLTNENPQLTSNFSYLIQNYDIISFYSDKIDSRKDRKQTNQIIEGQFNNINNRKRKFSAINFTQINNNSSQNIFPDSTNQNWDDDLQNIDVISLIDHYKKIIVSDLEVIKKDNFFNECANVKLLSKYIEFANEFIMPNITNYVLIDKLSQHLMNSFSDLINYELIVFDRRYIQRLIIKITLINARILLKQEVENHDIWMAYLFTKEIIQQNFIFYMNSKKNLNKGKKNKMNFMMEKIKQICSINSRKVITLAEIKEACDNADMSSDFDRTIENLNFSGFIIKINAEEYQLVG